MFKRFFIIMVLLFSFSFVNANNYIWDDDTKDIYTQNQDDVVETNDLNDPLRNGTRSAVENVQWIIDEDTSTAENNKQNMIKYISKWVNYFLWILWMIVTIFIIKDWIIIITAGGDDNKQKEAMKNLKNYILAIIWIWVSYLFVNLVFHFVITNV